MSKISAEVCHPQELFLHIITITIYCTSSTKIILSGFFFQQHIGLYVNSSRKCVITP